MIILLSSWFILFRYKSQTVECVIHHAWLYMLITVIKTFLINYLHKNSHTPTKYYTIMTHFVVLSKYTETNRKTFVYESIWVQHSNDVIFLFCSIVIVQSKSNISITAFTAQFWLIVHWKWLNFDFCSKIVNIFRITVLSYMGK